MSTSSWKNVVIGRQRMPAGIPRGLYGGNPRRSGRSGAQPARRAPEQVEAELRDAVVVVAQQHVAQARAGAPPAAPRSGRWSLTTATARRSASAGPRGRPRASTAEYGVPTQRARSMPECSEPERSPVEEDVLAGVGAQALPEQHHPRASPARQVPQPLGDHGPQQPVLLTGVIDHAQGQRRGALGVLERHRGHVAEGQVLGRGHGAVVDVTGPGRGREHEQRAVPAPVRSISARASSHAPSASARCPARRRPGPGRRFAGIPMTVSIDRSGTPAGRRAPAAGGPTPVRAGVPRGRASPTTPGCRGRRYWSGAPSGRPRRHRSPARPPRCPPRCAAWPRAHRAETPTPSAPRNAPGR